MECARRIGRKGFTAAEAQDVIEEAEASPRARKADDLARYLRLDYATRQALGITMIGAYDADKRERRRRRRERNRQAKELKRRARGSRLRSEYEAQSISRAKPWEAEGISRKTWYKRLKKNQLIDNTAEKQGSVPDNPQHQGDGTVGVTSAGTAVLLNAADTPVTPLPPASKKGLKRGRGVDGENQREVSPNNGEKQPPIAVPGPVTRIPRKGRRLDEAA
jgi:hypothetical protein